MVKPKPERIAQTNKKGADHTGIPGWSPRYALLMLVFATLGVGIGSVAVASSINYERTVGAINSAFAMLCSLAVLVGLTRFGKVLPCFSSLGWHAYAMATKAMTFISGLIAIGCFYDLFNYHIPRYAISGLFSVVMTIAFHFGFASLARLRELETEGQL